MRYEDFDEAKTLHEPFSMPFFRAHLNLRRTIELGITTVRDASGADAGLRDAVEEGTLVGPRMQVSVTMLSMTGGHSDPWLPSGGRGDLGRRVPGDALGGVRRRRRGEPQDPRDDPGRRRRDQDRVLGRVPLAGRRSDGAELLVRGGGVDREDRRRPRDVGDVARARGGGDQARGARGRAVDRPRHVPRRGGRRDDGGARHLARARPSRPATRPRSSRTIRTSPSRCARSSAVWAGRSSTRCAWPPRPA